MKIIVIGCGQVGAGLALNLSQRGHTMTVVDKDPTAFERLGPAFAGQTVAGIGFDRDVLLQAGIERADGLAAVTGSDEANAVIARVARQVFRVPRVVARLYDPRKAEVYQRLGLQTINPVTWGIHASPNSSAIPAWRHSSVWAAARWTSSRRSFLPSWLAAR